MANIYGFKNRSGKQCRERWHNHLDPNINKDYWSEKEENILFMKHIEYGNKWSDIAKFLPGRYFFEFYFSFFDNLHLKYFIII